MTDHDNMVGEGAFGGEPERDVELGHILRAHLGGSPEHEVDWSALAGRISSRIAAPASSWWDYAAGWDRRAIPLALAAGIVGAMLLFNTHEASASNSSAPDLFAEVASGTAPDEAVRFYSRAITSSAVEHLTTSVPE